MPAVEKICRSHNVAFENPRVFEAGSNLVVQVNSELIVKAYFPFLRNQYEAECAVMRAVEGQLPVQTPTLRFQGELDSWPYIGMTMVEGASLGTVWDGIEHWNRVSILQELGKLMRAFHSVPTKDLRPHLLNDWKDFQTKQIEGCHARHQKMLLPEHLLDQLQDYLPKSLDEIWDSKQFTLISGDFTSEHILLKQENRKWTICALIDFADCMLGQPDYDFSGPATFVIHGDGKLMRAMLTSYGYAAEDLSPSLSKKLMQLTFLHRFANFKEQIKLKDWETRFKNIEDLERAVWNFESSVK